MVYSLFLLCIQGPLPHTVEHFWQMIWEQNSAAVVMLNKVVEKNQVSLRTVHLNMAQVV